MKFRLIFLFILCLITQASAQKEAYHWYFGDGLGIDFDTGKAVITDKNTVLSNKANHYSSVSISSKSGEFLFQSNGQTVWNKDFKIMENGDNLYLESQSSLSKVLSFPKPRTPNVYCIVSSSFDTRNRSSRDIKINYSEIDMSLNNGLGKVILKKRILKLNRNLNHFSVVKHSNGEDVWIVIREKDTKNLVSYLLTESGLKGNAIVNEIGQDMLYYYKINFSPNAKYLIENGETVPPLGGSSQYLHTIVYNFDRTTGRISFLLKTDNHAIGFSPTSKFLYQKLDTLLLRYDLESNNIIASKETVYTYEKQLSNSSGLEFSDFQLGPDQKLYAFNRKAHFNGAEGGFYLGIKYPGVYSISTMDAPNHLDPNATDFEYEALSFEKPVRWAKVSRKFPEFITSQLNNILFYKNPCFEKETSFYLDDPVDSITWNFGDPTSGIENTATGLNPSHIYTALGTYTVTATATKDGITEELQTKVTIVELPELLTNSVELKQCDDDIDGFSVFNLNEVNFKISENFKEEYFSFHPTLEDAEKNENAILNTTSYTNKTRSQETIWARIENKHGCFRTTQVDLKVTTTQIPNTFEKIIVYSCEDEKGNLIFDFSEAQKEIEALFPPEQKLDFSYYTNLSDALAEINSIESLVSFHTTNINKDKQEVFVRIDSQTENDCLGLGNYITLKSHGKAPEFDLNETDFLCLSDPNLTISISNPLGDYNYEWTDASGSIVGTTPSIEIHKGGIYSVGATSESGCKSIIKEINIIEIPLANVSIDMIKIVGNTYDEYTVSLNAESLGGGDYKYSIDDEFGNYQEETVFEKVSSGWHTIYIRNNEQCANASLKFYIVGVPKFFTPNEDGINDTWNVSNLDPIIYNNISIEIFDRTGLLLTKIDPEGEGWDGYYQGKKMIVTDYWFTIIYKNPKGEIIKQEGNFSLLR